MILGINIRASDISKLSYVISRAVRQVKFETILKYHEWYHYAKYHVQIMLSFVYTTTCTVYPATFHAGLILKFHAIRLMCISFGLWVLKYSWTSLSSNRIYLFCLTLVFSSSRIDGIRPS